MEPGSEEGLPVTDAAPQTDFDIHHELAKMLYPESSVNGNLTDEQEAYIADWITEINSLAQDVELSDEALKEQAIRVIEQQRKASDDSELADLNRRLTSLNLAYRIRTGRPARLI